MGKRKKDPAETREQRAERKRKLCEAGEWTQCMCFIERKGRFCNMARAGGTGGEEEDGQSGGPGPAQTRATRRTCLSPSSSETESLL